MGGKREDIILMIYITRIDKKNSYFNINEAGGGEGVYTFL